jgi:hypothetical protein
MALTQDMCRQAMEAKFGASFATTERSTYYINDELKLGFVFQDVSHYAPINEADTDDFRNRVIQDSMALDAWDARGYYIITIPYNCAPEKLADFIAYYAPLR